METPVLFFLLKKNSKPPLSLSLGFVLLALLLALRKHPGRRKRDGKKKRKKEKRREKKEKRREKKQAQARRCQEKRRGKKVERGRERERPIQAHAQLCRLDRGNKERKKIDTQAGARAMLPGLKWNSKGSHSHASAQQRL